jgi:hypothetical protein
MAGSGGSTYGDYVARDDYAAGPSCSLLAFDAPVSSPDPTIVAALAVGAVCEVLLEGVPPQLRVYVRESGELVGAVTERWAELAGCIADGYRYEAQVTALLPAVRIHIQPRVDYLLPIPFRAHVEVTGAIVLTRGAPYSLELGTDRKVIAIDGTTTIGRILEEPVALPDAVEVERATTAVVTDPVTGAVEVRA